MSMCACVPAQCLLRLSSGLCTRLVACGSLNVASRLLPVPLFRLAKCEGGSTGNRFAALGQADGTANGLVYQECRVGGMLLRGLTPWGFVM